MFKDTDTVYGGGWTLVGRGVGGQKGRRLWETVDSSTLHHTPTRTRARTHVRAHLSGAVWSGAGAWGRIGLGSPPFIRGKRVTSSAPGTDLCRNLPAAVRGAAPACLLLCCAHQVSARLPAWRTADLCSCARPKGCWGDAGAKDCNANGYANQRATFKYADSLINALPGTVLRYDGSVMRDKCVGPPIHFPCCPSLVRLRMCSRVYCAHVSRDLSASVLYSVSALRPLLTRSIRSDWQVCVHGPPKLTRAALTPCRPAPPTRLLLSRYGSVKGSFFYKTGANQCSYVASCSYEPRCWPLRQPRRHHCGAQPPLLGCRIGTFAGPFVSLFVSLVADLVAGLVVGIFFVWGLFSSLLFSCDPFSVWWARGTPLAVFPPGCLGMPTRDTHVH